jgi:uncharacterized membrane protein
MNLGRWRFISLLLILWLAFGLRLYHLDFQSIWWDEGHSIFVAAHPLSNIPTLPAMDVHPPAYFALLHLWMAVTGQSEFALRYLSVLFSLLTLALLWRFAAGMAKLLPSVQPAHSAAPLLATLLAGLSPLYVAYAQEVRSYALITFLALISTFMLWRILYPSSNLARSGQPSRGSGQWSLVATYILITTACLYTHYFTIFLLIFHNLAWLGRLFLFRPRRPYLKPDLLVWFVAQLGIFILFIPQFLLALRQVTSYTNPNLTPPGLSQYLSRTWQAYTVGLTIDPGLAWWGMVLIAAVLVIFWLWILTQGVNYQPESSVHSSLFTIYYSLFTFLSAWFFIPLAAYFVVLQRQASFEPRYMILVTPALFLLLGLGIGQVLNAKYDLSSIAKYTLHLPFYVLAFIPMLVFLISLHSYYTNETYFKDDSAGVARWLAGETTPNDLVYVDVPHPFHYYVAKGYIAAPTRYLFVDIHTAAATLTAAVAGRQRLFWVTWRGSDTDPRGVIPFLAQKYGQKLGQRNFRGYQVEWFSLPPAGAVFSLPTDLPPLRATFGQTLQLDGAAYGGQPPAGLSLKAGQLAWATLHFTLLQATAVDYKASLRLRSPDGRLVAQVDRELLNDRHLHTSAWPLDDAVLNQAINVYTLPVAADASPGVYRLEVVVYNSQPPYPSEGVTGSASPDGISALIGSLNVIP